MTNELVTPKFKVGDKVTHHRFGAGVVREVWAIAEANTNQETEYVVKIRGERYPATLGEFGLTLR